MLNILVEFDRFCNKHNLRYCLGYGTLLGAIRHHGFIPWDNDVDVVMPRPDYEKFRELTVLQPIAEHITTLDYKHYDTFPFLKIVDNRTSLREQFLRNDDNLGIYVDIFPLDGIPDDEEKVNTLFAKSKEYSKKYVLASYRFNTGATPTIKLIKNLLYPISLIMPKRKICEKLDNLCQEYIYDTSENVVNIVWDESFPIYKREWFDKLIKVKFESYEFFAPEKYDEVLSVKYGNYMQLPPEEDRVVHFYNASWKSID